MKYLLALFAVLPLTLAGAARAQSGVPAPYSEADPPRVVAPVPFGPGEKAEYEVRLGIFGGVGSGAMEVLDVAEVRGHRTYHLRFRLKGGILFAKVDDTLQSWLDVSKLVARRFKQDQKEVNYERHRTFEFFPEERRWTREQQGRKPASGELPTDEPLDDVSFIYYVRTLPLEVGQTYTLDRYFQEDGNPVVVKVVRRETVEVPAGTFRTVVVQPVIKTDGLFGEGGKAEIYFTDDERRLLVLMKSSVPVVGKLSLHLKSFTPGEKLSPLLRVSSPEGGR